MSTESRLSVTAIILAHKRLASIELVLRRLVELGVDEVLVVDNGGSLALAAEDGDRVRVLRPGRNLGEAGRNVAAREARNELLLMLDDDSYPLPGAIETLAAAFEAQPRLAVGGGFVRDIDGNGDVIRDVEVGTFDWYLRAGRAGPAPEGLPSFFFPAGAALVRRTPLLEVGGFFEPYFHTNAELDLTTRLVGAGWDVRYFPSAAFDHSKDQGGRAGVGPNLRMRIRNHLWYFWLYYPATLAVRRMAGYLLYDLIQCLYRGVPSAWLGGIGDAWRDRAAVRGRRRPLSRETLRRAELNRGRMHMRLLAEQTRLRLAPGRRA